MKKKDSSSWSEIKSLDERLAREPDSFCFARLSEIYLKVGLVADALHTARQGVAKHPGYLAGQRALAMACNANGLHEESRTLLEQVTAALPEDTAAQKLLASLYVEAGDTVSAIRAFTTLLDFRPDDVQSKAQIEDLQRGATAEPLQLAMPADTVAADDAARDDAVVTSANDDLEEEVYELSEDDIVTDEEETSHMEAEPASSPAVDVSAAPHHDPLSTLTLAELYEQQGFTAKALDIYRTILADDPANIQLQAKVAALESQDAAAENPPEQLEAPESTEEPEQFLPAAREEFDAPPEEAFIASAAPEDVAGVEVQSFDSAAFEELSAPVAADDFPPLVHNQADNVVEALDSLLENIRRIKACR